LRFITAEQRGVFCRYLADKILDGQEVLSEAFVHASRCQHKPLEKGTISLVECRAAETDAADGDDLRVDRHDVWFVHWDDIALRKARRVRVGTLRDLKYNVGFKVPSLVYPEETTTIHIRDMQVAMWKNMDLREPMPEWALTLQRHFRAKVFAGPIVVSEADVSVDLLNVCVACSVARMMGINGVYGEEVPAFLCSQCTYPWHTACVAYAAGDGQYDFASITHFQCPICVAPSEPV
jgi:hypothetical protein